MNEIRYNHEYTTRVRACFIGAGGHSFRNVYPAFQYAPVELLAVCDRDEARAAAYARQFGARAHYSDHAEMLARERPDAVFIVTSYDADGTVQATRLALDALSAGAHVWMEKPTASSTAQVRELMSAAERSGRMVMTGLKKVFAPAITKVREIIRSPEFGRPTSMYARYPQAMPSMERRRDPAEMVGLLDHIYHPAAIVHDLMGGIDRMSYQWEPRAGASVTSIRFLSGAIGVLHLVAGISGSSPLERLEVVGEGANVVLENGVDLTYHRRCPRPAYGRAPSYIVDDAVAPLRWTPEFSLGQLSNKGMFLLGYVPEVLHFCECVLSGTAPERGGLDQVMEIMKLFEAYRTTAPGETAVLNA